jgi:hypothetical protein
MGFQATNVALAADEIEKMVRSRSLVPRGNLVALDLRVCSITLWRCHSLLVLAAEVAVK